MVKLWFRLGNRRTPFLTLYILHTSSTVPDSWHCAETPTSKMVQYECNFSDMGLFV